MVYLIINILQFIKFGSPYYSGGLWKFFIAQKNCVIPFFTGCWIRWAYPITTPQPVLNAATRTLESVVPHCTAIPAPCWVVFTMHPINPESVTSTPIRVWGVNRTAHTVANGKIAMGIAFNFCLESCFKLFLVFKLDMH